MEATETAKFLENLNPKQLEAVVEKNGAILVLAGAGSGKTKVLTSRIANILSNGASPYSVLALTFTNKAAKEMQSRLSSYLGEDTVKRMWVGTFHNICGRILRKHLDKYKTKDGREWNNNYVIYDETDTKTIIKNAVKKLNLDEKIYEVKLVKSVISNAKNKLQDAHAFAAAARDYKSEKYAEIYMEYETQLALNNAIDFDDMLLLTVNLLEENEEVRQEYATRFSHILVDEFQDTNKAQYKLIRMLFNDKKALEQNTSLMVVGDVDQSIYSWRGADFRIILGFQKDYDNAKLIKLEQNYRSTNTILKAANALIENNEQRLSKNLYSNQGDGEKIQIYEASDDYNESNYVARQIKEFLRDGRNIEDIAILYRTNAQSRNIEEALMANSIPYKIIGGLKFYDRKEIKDIIAYLKLIYNTSDSSSLRRIINTPKRSIGETTVKKIMDIADSREVSMYEVIRNIEECSEFNASTKSRLNEFYKLIEDFISKQEVYSLSELVGYILDYSGYLKELKEEDTIENQSRIENLQEFLNLVSEFEEDEFALEDENQTRLGTFLTQVALVSDVDDIKENEESVTLMTLHSAKGLEYPIIFLTGLEEGLFPHSRALSYQATLNDLEEERRLMYVGITRAKEILKISYAKRRMQWGELKTFPKSRFIDEIPQNLVEFEADEKEEREERPSQNRYQNNNNNYYRHSNSGFSKAVKKIKEENSKPTEFKTSSNNLASSLKAFVKKKDNSLASSLANYKNQNLNSTNIRNNEPQFKKRQEEKPKQETTTNIKDLIAKCKAQATAHKTEPQKSLYGTFPIGTRVFHSKFGIGHIENVENDTNPIYTVNFIKHGIKTLDASIGDLKTF